jgi:short-subunit dehydrogenase
VSTAIQAVAYRIAAAVGERGPARPRPLHDDPSARVVAAARTGEMERPSTRAHFIEYVSALWILAKIPLARTLRWRARNGVGVFSYHDQAVVVSGASSGIGRALALELAARRSRLFLTGRDEARLMATAAACRDAGAVSVETLIADLSKPAECERLVRAAVSALGRLDVLVNNAGIGMWAHFRDVKDPSWISRIMDTNYGSVAYTTYYALPHLLASRGRLGVVSSLAGLIPVASESLYCASKFAIHGLCDSLRVELRGTGVSVTMLAPDLVPTGIFASAVDAAGQVIGAELPARKGTPVEACARVFADGLARRRRRVLTSYRSGLAPLLHEVWPSLVEAVTEHEVKALPTYPKERR